jgi:solute carrier family 25 (mitochondrial carnitine/acylcarnitine transporter), member 20/29
MEEGLQTSAIELSEGTRDFLSGGIAGAAGVVVGNPLDVAKSRSQVFPNTKALSHLKSIVTKEGVFSLFKGMSYPLTSSMLQNAVVFHSYGTALRLFGHSNTTTTNPAIQTSPPQRQSLTHHIFTAGCFAGAIQTLVVTPIDLLKINLQLQTAIPSCPSYRGPIQMALDIFRRHGLLRGLYRGTVITALRDIPSHGVYFTVFELTRECFMNYNSDKGGEKMAAMHNESNNGTVNAFFTTNGIAILGAGGLAGSMSWASIYPIDVVKTRYQSRHHHSSSTGSSNCVKPAAGLWECAVSTYKEGGVKTFTRGFWATMCRAFIVNGAIFGAYEASSSWLGSGTAHSV